MQSKLLQRLHRPAAPIDDKAILRWIRFLDHEDERVQMDAVRKLIRAGEHAVPALIDALGSPDEKVWQLASVALLKIGDHAVPDLVDSLSNPQENIRMYAAAILQRMGRPAPDEPGFAAMWREYGKLLALQQQGAAQS
jgi:HEAT repeat protein